MAYFITANIILKTFSEIGVMPMKQQITISRASLIFQKRFSGTVSS